MKSDFLKRQQSIRFVKSTFTEALSENLNLTEIQAPILTDPTEGVQDTLSGHEKAVKVSVLALQRDYEVVHSLAKWKRQTLGQYGFSAGEGIVTQMKALRPDEEALSEVHSVYVDQWDWEQVIPAQARTRTQLQAAASSVWKAIVSTHSQLESRYGPTDLELPEQLTFISTEQLLQQYPELSPKEREHAICERYGAVFLIGIGAVLSNGQRHDVRAPDYDDWTTHTADGEQGLNGDLLVWSPVLQRSIELSSMGIRVDRDALLHQLELSGRSEQAQLPWHQMLIQERMPATVGGGIGQSRLCMWMLQQPHIGYVQPGVWSTATHEKYQGLL